LANDEKVNVDINHQEVAKYYKLGEEVYKTKRGLRGLACYSCHSDQTIGMRLRMQILPNLGDAESRSGATWPAYRMTKSEMTTIQKRFQGCMQNSSMAILPLGSKEMVALETYVNALANGKDIAIPGLKR
jgi:sulfur-oxidizing protein SoxA